MNRIEPRSGVAFELPRGAELTVCDPEGRQVSDLLAYNAQDVREVISNGRTFDYEETLRLGKGNRLWSNRSNVMLEIEEDSLGQHDFDPENFVAEGWQLHLPSLSWREGPAYPARRQTMQTISTDSGGSDAAVRIAEWVEATFPATTVDGVTLYDLSAS